MGGKTLSGFSCLQCTFLSWAGTTPSVQLATWNVNRTQVGKRMLYVGLSQTLESTIRTRPNLRCFQTLTAYKNVGFTVLHVLLYALLFSSCQPTCRSPVH